MKKLYNQVGCYIPAQYRAIIQELATNLGDICGGVSAVPVMGLFQGQRESTVLVTAYCDDEALALAERACMLAAYKLLIRGEQAVLVLTFDGPATLVEQHDKAKALDILRGYPKCYREAISYE